MRLLGSSDLQHLYTALGISHHDVEKAEDSVQLRDVSLKANAVLRFWLKDKGEKATRSAIFDALRNCRNTSAVEKLKRIWKHDIDLEHCQYH